MKHSSTITITGVLFLGLVANANGQSTLPNSIQDIPSSPMNSTTQTIQKAALPIVVTPDNLQWKDAPNMLPPGAQMSVLEGNLKTKNYVTLRIKMPANYQVAPLYSQSLERITVLSGTINIGTGNKLDTNNGTALPTGSFVVVPANKHFYIWSSEDSVIQINGMGPWAVKYVNSKDDPRKAAASTGQTPATAPASDAIIGHPENGISPVTSPAVPASTPTPANPSSY